MPDHYQTLGVSRTASEQDIRAAYYRKAKEVHPDRNGPTKGGEDGQEPEENHAQQFHQIREAYEVLSDPKSRGQYDRFHHLKPHQLSSELLNNAQLRKLFQGTNNSFFHSTDDTSCVAAAAPRPPVEEPPPKRPCVETLLPSIASLTQGMSNMPDALFHSMPSYYHFSNAKRQSSDEEASLSKNSAVLRGSPPSTSSSNTNDTSFRSTTSSSSSAAFSSGTQEPAFQSLSRFHSLSNLVGEDSGLQLNTTLNISFQESVTGATNKQVVYQCQEICPQCQGKSKSPQSGDKDSRCGVCGGLGLVRVEASASVSLPPGVVDGYQMRLPERGNTAPSGRKGDLVVTVKTAPHPFFRRKNQLDVTCDLPVSMVQAAMGVVLQIPSLRGTVKVQVKAGTQSHEVITLPQEGFVDYRDNSVKGDMCIRVLVQIPKTLTPRQKELLKEFEKAAQV